MRRAFPPSPPPPGETAMTEVAQGLARAFLAGSAGRPEMTARGRRALGRSWPWLAGLVRQLAADFGETQGPADHDELVAAILAHVPFRRAFDGEDDWPRIVGYFPFHPPMAPPVRPLSHLALPPLATTGELAHWLGLTATELDWFADPGGWGGASKAEALRHYRYRWLAKPAGGHRLLESPKPRLKALQRQILRHILNLLPVHPAAQGCVPGRSMLDHAAGHVGRERVVRLDLEEFFGSVSGARVQALFLSLGYPLPVARSLAGLTTHGAPPTVAAALPRPDGVFPEVWRRQRSRAMRLTGRHLPQGAPTSPSLANLCAFRLDLRLAGAATTIGATYGRYVDDLYFSADGVAADRLRRFIHMVYGIILEEGFIPNVAKTRLMAGSAAQRVTGLVVNRRLNLPRRDYDGLKATLTNCLRHGLVAENRQGHPDFRAHLAGRVAYLEQVNPVRGARLRRLLEALPAA